MSDSPQPRSGNELLFCSLLGWYFLLVSVLLWEGILSCGQGLGDAAAFLFSGVLGLATHGVVWFLKKRADPPRVAVRAMVITLALLALYYTFWFTLGRGVEDPWDGDIFRSSLPSGTEAIAIEKV